MTINILINLSIVILYIIAFSIKLAFLNGDNVNFFNTNKYVNTYNIANYYNQVYYIECLLLIIVFHKILNFLKLYDYVRLFYASIFVGFITIAKYFIFIVFILLGYTSIAHILWGPFIEDYRSFGDSFLSILLFTAGNYIF